MDGSIPSPCKCNAFLSLTFCISQTETRYGSVLTTYDGRRRGNSRHAEFDHVCDLGAKSVRCLNSMSDMPEEDVIYHFIHSSDPSGIQHLCVTFSVSS
jgi:hypothetical protein